MANSNHSLKSNVFKINIHWIDELIKCKDKAGTIAMDACVTAMTETVEKDHAAASYSATAGEWDPRGSV